MEQHQNSRVGEMGEPRENLRTSGIVWHHSTCKNPEAAPLGFEYGSPRWEARTLPTKPPRPLQCELTKMGLLDPRSDPKLTARENELKSLSSFFRQSCLVGKWSSDPAHNARLRATGSTPPIFDLDPDLADVVPRPKSLEILRHLAPQSLLNCGANPMLRLVKELEHAEPSYVWTNRSIGLAPQLRSDCGARWRRISSDLGQATYSNLCALCEHPDKCDYPDKYSGYNGALRCLAEHGGDVAFTKVYYVKKHFGLPIGGVPPETPVYDEHPEEYAYLCQDGTRIPITGPPCRWGARPWQGFITNNDLLSSVSDLRNQISLANTEGAATNAHWLSKVLTIDSKTLAVDNTEPVSPQVYLDKEQRRNAREGGGREVRDTRENPPTSGIDRHDSHNRKFGTNYTDVIERESGTTHFPVRFCVTSQVELAKCRALTISALSRDIRPAFDCELKSSLYKCMRVIRDGGADVVAVSAIELQQAISSEDSSQLTSGPRRTALTSAALLRRGVLATFGGVGDGVLGNLANFNQNITIWMNWGLSGVGVRALSTHQGEQGSIPGLNDSTFSYMGIVSEYATGLRVFSGMFLFSRPCTASYPLRLFSTSLKISVEFNLRPIAAEVYGALNGTVSVAIVKKSSPYQSLEDLRGARSCHTGYGRISGKDTQTAPMIIIRPAQLEEEHCTLARAGDEHLYTKTRLGKVKEAAGIAERRMEGARVCEAELFASSSHQTALGRARNSAGLSSLPLTDRGDSVRECVVAGWLVPLYTLLAKNLIAKDNCPYAKGLSEFFSGGSCVPGALDTHNNPSGANPSRLCSLCVGGQNNGHYYCERGAAVVQWLARSPATKAIRVRTPVDPLPGFSHVEIELNDAACRLVFSGSSSFHRPCIPAPLHPRASLHVMLRDDGRLRVPAATRPGLSVHVPNVYREWMNGPIRNNHCENCGAPRAIDIRDTCLQRTLQRMALRSRWRVAAPMLTQVHRRKRLEFTVQYSNWTAADWRRAAFSDESRIHLHRTDGRQHVRRETLENRHPASMLDQHKAARAVLWPGECSRGACSQMQCAVSVYACEYSQLQCDVCVAGVCLASPNEAFFGYTGALRCLATSHGDVAFAKHVTLEENTEHRFHSRPGNLHFGCPGFPEITLGELTLGLLAPGHDTYLLRSCSICDDFAVDEIHGRNQADWAKHLRSEDFELLCPDGGRRPVSEYASCHLAEIPSHMVVTSNSKSDMSVETIRHALMTAANLYSKRPELFRLFGDFMGKSDLLFLIPEKTRRPAASSGTISMCDLRRESSPNAATNLVPVTELSPIQHHFNEMLYTLKGCDAPVH
ncbi:hypothetical protein PR048_003932 [Dryococelus australis]|uniref:Transferrin-like domain-containing protein n=1 Tax=Dryococelus australis TaxID=614101 RepID=A0ABQ9IPG3_9NEOP|nr:hypothetical protein PR048_003932 [Dryococelus australis]